jgi:hypothetical protein
MAGDFYVPADPRVLLYLDECSYPAVVSDGAPVEVHEAIDADILPQLDVRSDATELRQEHLPHI